MVGGQPSLLAVGARSLGRFDFSRHFPCPLPHAPRRCGCQFLWSSRGLVPLPGALQVRRHWQPGLACPAKLADRGAGDACWRRRQ